MQYLLWAVLATFLIPLWELGLMVVGILYALLRFKRSAEDAEKMIIQITTLGREQELVQRTVNVIRSYKLKFPYEIWVVVEPGYSTDYTSVDRVLVVPPDFESRAVDKARALHYALSERIRLNLANQFIKVLLLDDDTCPSRRYVVNSYKGDYDYCQGVTVVNREYGTGPWQHWLSSLLDGIRVRNCLIYCSCTQGITNKPLFVHGEGLCLRGHAERIVGWNWPIVASDDLVHGTNAAYQGFSWGYHLSYIQLVSPWTIRESILQKHRWTWGNFMAIGSRDIMPLSVAVPKALKYGVGFVSIACSLIGIIALYLGYIKVPAQVHGIYLTSLAAWLGSYGLAGWLNSGGTATRERIRTKSKADGQRRPIMPWRVRFVAFRIWQTVVGIIMCPVTAIAPVVIITLAVVMGKDRRHGPYKRKDGKGFTFEVIDKTRRDDEKELLPIV